MTGFSWDDDGAQEGLLTRRSAQNCLNEKEIEDYLFQRLSGVTREVIEEHLLGCEECQKQVELEEAYVRSFRTAATRLEAAEFEASLVEAVPERRLAGPPQQPWWHRLTNPFALIPALVVVTLAIGVLLQPGWVRRAPAEIALVVVRGAAETSARATAKQPLHLVANLADLPPLPRWDVEIVDAAGVWVAAPAASGQQGRLSVDLPSGLPAGVFWVRLLDPSNRSLVREFGLIVR